MRFRRRPDSEALYREGVDRWSNRDVEGAVELLNAALSASLGPYEDNWWFSASRTMAQMALEQGDAEAAGRHLALLPGHGVGNAQQEALRAKAAFQGGEEEQAALHVSIAVQQLASDEDEDLGTLMNGAIALMWCGEVLVDLGYGSEAARLVRMARRRIEAAQVDDPVLEGGLAMVGAGAARLMGDVNGAMAALSSIDRSISPDLGFQVTAEKARLAWRNEDYDTARRLYVEAAEAAGSLRYPAVSVALRAEERSGPAGTKTHPLPAEEWAQHQLEQELANSRPCALVVRLIMGDRSYESYLEMGERVEELVEANPHLGVVEGWGTVDDIWELFIDGEDPDALWQAVRPLMNGLAGPGSEVELRRSEGVETRALA